MAVPSGESRTRATPTGTVTFLFTDAEGSTQRWETRTAAMAEALRRHEAILQAAVYYRGGYVFKTTGDGMCAAFERASEAAAAALEAQCALGAEDFGSVGDLRIRMALHTGEAQERDGDYFGPAVNRVARLLSIGHGGQVLLSGSTARLLEAEPQWTARMIDMGAHRLKDLAEPEHVYQLRTGDALTEFPPLRSLDALPNNLPLELTSLVGRDGELADLASRLQHVRLLTLVGSGGVGKTRLAVRLGGELIERYPDGVWFFEFASVSDPNLIESVAASALNLRAPKGVSVLESILAALKHKRTLLIFDNCEHVADAAAALAGMILRSCPHAVILATSREPLAIDGEQIHRVASLSFPTSSRGIRPEDALRYGAVALFVERARAVDECFELTPENAPVVADICRRVDGIALAIELAAARVKVLDVTHIDERLRERFRLLTGGSRTALPRHRTMRALIDWSYDLLSKAEKTLFRRVSVFAGDYSAEAAMAICAGEPLSDADVLDVTLSLVEKSLINAERGSGLERYRLLESTRDYALEKLKEDGEHLAIAGKHADYYRRLAEQADRTFDRAPQAEWFEFLKREVENLRSALLWTLFEHCDPVLGGALAGALERFWIEVGPLTEGRRWIDRALELLDKPSAPEVEARLWLARAVLSEGAESREDAARACSLYETLGDCRGLGYALCERGLALRMSGKLPEAEASLRRACTMLEEAGEPGGFAVAMNRLGAISAFRGEFEAARATYEKALNAAHSHAAEYAIMISYLHLADLEFQCGNFEIAIGHAGEALQRAKASKSTRLLANLLGNLAAYRIALERLPEAAADAREALRILFEAPNSYQIAIAVQHLALIAALSNDRERAARLTGYVDGYFNKNGLAREPTEEWSRTRIEQALRANAAESAFLPLMHEGGRLSEHDAILEALAVQAAAR